MPVSKAASKEGIKTFPEIFLNPPPQGLEEQYHTLLTPEAVKFLIRLTEKFDDDITALYTRRHNTKYQRILEEKILSLKIPILEAPYLKKYSHILEAEWKIPIARK